MRGSHPSHGEVGVTRLESGPLNGLPSSPPPLPGDTAQREGVGCTIGELPWVTPAGSGYNNKILLLPLLTVGPGAHNTSVANTNKQLHQTQSRSFKCGIFWTELAIYHIYVTSILSLLIKLIYTGHKYHLTSNRSCVTFDRFSSTFYNAKIHLNDFLCWSHFLLHPYHQTRMISLHFRFCKNIVFVADT